MHMADALVSPAVGIAMCVLSAGAVAFSCAKVGKDELSEKKVPVMAVAGAFVFAAQMINFTIPGTGSSGHIGGGILLASMLGAYPSLLTISAVLIIQALFFADGGLLALGCNIFNLGVIPCLVVYPLVFRPIVRGGFTKARLTAASITGVIIALELGSFSVVLQTLVSGITELPFVPFTAVMLPIHLAIGLVEGIVTALVVCFVHSMRPELVEGGAGSKTGVKKLVAILAALTVIVGGGLSLFASELPDGLEWAVEKTAGAEPEADGAIHAAAEAAQRGAAVMPDYGFENGSAAGTPVAGIVGGAITFAAAGAAGLIISRIKRKRGENV